MIYLTGDTHGEIDIHKLSANKNVGQVLKNCTKDDYLIICGDFGLVWDGSKEEKWWQKWLNDKPYTTLFVDGNHENTDLLSKYPIEEWNGGKVQFIQPSVIHLMRGQMYTIDNKKIFTMGGGTSIDRWRRKEGVSWWPQEIPSDDELKEGIDNLDKNNWKVDYIVTHEAPNSIHDLAIGPYSEKKHDKLTCYLESLLQDLQFDKWYFGHYHRTDTFGDKSQFRLLYDDVVKAGETEPILSGEEQERRRKVVEEMNKRLKKLKEEDLM